MKPLFPRMLLCALALFLLTSCGGGNAGSGGVGNNKLISKTDFITTSNANPTGFAFQSPIFVSSGQTIQWENQTGVTHGITWDNQVPGTSPAPPATVPEFPTASISDPVTMPVVTTQTTYNYHCTVHGPMMSGQIVVSP